MHPTVAGCMSKRLIASLTTNHEGESNMEQSSSNLSYLRPGPFFGPIESVRETMALLGVTCKPGADSRERFELIARAIADMRTRIETLEARLQQPKVEAEPYNGMRDLQQRVTSMFVEGE